MSKACSEALHQMIVDARRRRVFTILTQRCEYVAEMSEIVKTRHELRERIQSRFIRMFERAQKLSALAPTWTPRIAGMTLHSLMFGLMSNLVLDCPECPSPSLEKTNNACIAAFFKAVSVKLT